MTNRRRAPARLLIAGTAGLLLASLAVAAPAIAESSPESSPEASPPSSERAAARSRPVVINVHGSRLSRPVRANLLGTNHRYTRNGFGLWDPKLDRPERRVVKGMRRASIKSLRYPGGTTAAMYHWKGAIGSNEQRNCQIEGHGSPSEGFGAVREKLAYGPDEFMEVIDATGANPLIMMPFITQTPKDAADWVEYMNARAGTNPDGGKAWARVRARNGHRRPYDVRRWEIGNESHVAPGRYRFSTQSRKALRQYMDGGVRNVRGEALGRRCAHRPGGVQSNGRKRQVFEVTYTPAKIQRVTVGGDRWRRIANIRNAGPRARRYEVLGDSGRVLFGSGVHGRIPREGATVRASYRNEYAGFFDFARRMHSIDRSIKVCATWGEREFPIAAGRRNYDCMSAHPITNFNKRPRNGWRDALEGHDRMMLGLDERVRTVRSMIRQLPRRTPLLLTEFQPIHGYERAYPSWAASMSNAVYMASQWQSWLVLGISWGNGGALLGQASGSVLGSGRHPTYSVEAVTREAIAPMFRAGGRVVQTDVRRSPVRRPDLRRVGGYRALSVVASRSKNMLWLFVVNRAPTNTIKATIRLRDITARGKAKVRRVDARSYRVWNRPGEPRRVVVDEGRRPVGRHQFRATFPAHSVTVLRIPRR